MKYISTIIILFTILNGCTSEKLSEQKLKQVIITGKEYATFEEKGGYQIGAANQTITAILASEQVAEYLDVKKGEAILRMRQISFFDDGTPFEYVRSQYVGSRFEFYLEK